MRTAIAAFAFIALTTHAASAEEDLAAATAVAERAISMGYGTECTLELEPAPGGLGYWPCVDFGPYRYIKGYGEARFAVTQEDRKPFVVAHGKNGQLAWLHDGPWQRDLRQRVVGWWSDVAGGGAARAQAEAERSEAAEAAAAYIRSLNGEPPVTPSQAEPEPGPSPVTEAISPDARAILQMAD